MKKAIVIAVIVLVALGLALDVYMTLKKEIKIYIFSDIKECEKLDNDDGSFYKYDSPLKDSKLGDLVYKDFYAGKYKTDEFEFEIFAYKFENFDNSKKYFENQTGIASDELDTNFWSGKGMSEYTLVVMDGENAYVVSSSKEDEREVTSFLATTFTKRIVDNTVE